ncbi:MAG: hypothetical protein B7Y89_14035 [Novosphingobium sp. 32-60-15]|nr:hypothetical protein [Novosphingobium sp. 32-60-15]OYX61225.1 MAG: hypothetical protein B7Y89_14035 [Novosphingobium sp. 32-60-15]
MPFTRSTVALAALAPMSLLLASCGGGATSSGGPAQVRSVAPPVRTNVPRPAPVTRPSAQIQMIPGLESVIGADALQLGRIFGTPRLDLIEDDARKLQWTGTACILDVYLYPQPGSSRATATYVDARRGDGRDVDRAACVAALRKAP